MRKICILSPGRCGSLLLFSYLRIHFCDRYQDLVHTHDLNEALELENQGFQIVVMQRRSMFEWVLSRVISDMILNGTMKNEESFHNANNNQIEIKVEKYQEVRHSIRAHVSSYKDKWPVYFYEDLVSDPFPVIEKVLKSPSKIPSKTKLNYDKQTLISNYADLLRLEQSGTVSMTKTSINTLSQD